MPKRSNKFQKLVHLIHLQITDSKVIESAMFVDQRTGEKREVDVAILSEVADYPIIISIECRDHSRPQSTGWIEEMWAKHQALLTSSLVLVSSSGFYKPALVAAKKLGVETLSLKEAEESNWQSLLPAVRRFKVTEIWTTPVRCTIIPDEAWLPVGMQQTTLSLLEVFTPENEPLGTLKDIFDNAINSIKLESKEHTTEYDNISFDFDGKVKFKSGTYMVFEGQQHMLREMVFRIHFDGYISEVNPKKFKFKDKMIHAAESENKYAEIIYTVLPAEENNIKAGASIAKLKNIPDACIWDFAVPQEYLDNKQAEVKPLNYKDQTQFKTKGKPSPDSPKLSLHVKLQESSSDESKQ